MIRQTKEIGEKYMQNISIKNGQTGKPQKNRKDQ